ncbi:MAG: hypothetical protein JW888_11195 [Pirellulales bacterium]|nr:hypothetical protein [Pirellulales bacterium]
MKLLFIVASITTAVLAAAGFAAAAVVGDQNWADDVEIYTENIQNYAHVLMDDSTTWWLTGPPDATQTDDFVGGWCANAPGEYIVMHWASPLVDLPGDDLVVRLFSGPAASAEVLASVDGVTYTSIGTLGGGTPLAYREEMFDFDERFAGDVSYVMLQRDANGPQTGVFFDALGSTVVPELIPGDANNDKRVDETDAQALARHWGEADAVWTMGDFDDDDFVGPADAAILAAHWGYGTSGAAAVAEPSTLFLIVPLLAMWFRRSGRFC